MKRYKKTIKRLRKSKDMKADFLMQIAKKFEKTNSASFKLRLLHIKRRFFSSGLLEMMLMMQLEQKIKAEAKEAVKGQKVVNIKDFRG